MSRIVFISIAALLPLSLAWGAAADGDLPLADSASCDIRVDQNGGSLVLEGLVTAPVPVSGSYELKISQGGSAGSSNIRQGGDFDVAPGADGSLGVVTLSSRGNYAATLVVHWHDGAPDCTRHVGSERPL